MTPETGGVSAGVANGPEVAELIVHNTLLFEFSGMSKRKIHR